MIAAKDELNLSSGQSIAEGVADLVSENERLTEEINELKNRSSKTTRNPDIDKAINLLGSSRVRKP